MTNSPILSEILIARSRQYRIPKVAKEPVSFSPSGLEEKNNNKTKFAMPRQF